MRVFYEHFCRNDPHDDTVNLVQTSAGIIFEYFFSTQSKLFLRKVRNIRSAFAEHMLLKNASRVMRTCFPMIPCTLCVHLLVSSEYPAYAVYSHILCRQKPAHGFSFCFLWFISFLFLSQKKKRKKRTYKK